MYQMCHFLYTFGKILYDFCSKFACFMGMQRRETGLPVATFKK